MENWKIIPTDIWNALNPDQRNRMRNQLQRAFDANKSTKTASVADDPNKLLATEKKALMLIYNEMPTYAAQPTKELDEFDSWLDTLEAEEKIQILKSLALIDSKNGAKIISDIVEREEDARIIFVKNSGLLM